MKIVLTSSLLAVSILAAYIYANQTQQTTVEQVQSIIVAPTTAVDDGSESASLLGGNGTAQTYCSATPNSFGTTARIGYIGSLGTSQGSFGLRVTGLPVQAQAFGVFTYGGTQMNVPFGNGYLCINPLGGLYRMTPQLLTDTTVSRSVTEAPAEFALFQPATTWNFQFWYRNPAAGGAGFNLSDGLRVQFGN